MLCRYAASGSALPEARSSRAAKASACERGADVPAHDLEHLLERQRAAVGPVGRQGVEHVGHRQDAGVQAGIASPARPRW